MVNLNFDSTLVLVMFAQANPGVTAPTQAVIVRFDSQLQRDNEPLLTNIMRANGVPTDTLSKSKILAFMPNMPGNTPDLQIANACTYFLNTQQALTSPGP
jgi:hypothetical protein